MVLLDIRDLLLTGRLGSVGPGATRQEVLRIFGTPDAFDGDARRPERASILLYGGIELHFLDDGSLRSIFSDHLPLDRVATGPVRQEPWCLGGPHPVAVTAVREALAQVGLRAEVRPRDPRWADPIPQGPRLRAEQWPGVVSIAENFQTECCFAELVLPSGVDLTVGYHRANLADGTSVFTEDLVVALGRACI